MSRSQTKFSLGLRFVWFAAIAIFASLVYASSRKYPSVFADEYFYSRFSRLLPFSDSLVPNYLYFAAYQLTNECGENFLFCGRILNTLFFVATAPIIYFTAANYCSRTNAAWVAVLSLIAPFSLYVAFYMPESMFYLASWVFFWRVSRASVVSSNQNWALAGISLGLAALVKPHALFMVPALLLYVAWHGHQVTQVTVVRVAANWAILLGCCLGFKFAVGYFFAGRGGLSFFGSAYGSLAKGQSGGIDRYLQLLTPWAENTLGHVLGLCTLFALAIFLGASSSLTNLKNKSAEQIARTSISVFTLLIIGSLLCVSSLFTVYVAGSAPSETAHRLHMRYYNFAFPLLFIVLATHASVIREKSQLFKQLLIAAPILGCLTYLSFSNGLVRYTTHIADSPELYGLVTGSRFFNVTVGVGCILTVLALRFRLLSTAIMLYFALPVMLLGSTYFSIDENRAKLAPHRFDIPGLFAKRNLGDSEIGKVAVVGSDSAAVYQALFHVDHAKAVPVFVSDIEKFELKDRPIGADWLLLLDPKKTYSDISFSIERRGFTLVRAKVPFLINFSSPDQKSAFLEHIDGMVQWPEPWGRWSEGKQTKISFAGALPKTLKVAISAFTLPQNVDQPFIARLGQCEQTFFLKATPSKVFLTFNCTSDSKTFELLTSSQDSEKAAGTTDRKQELQIALIDITFEL